MPRRRFIFWALGREAVDAADAREELRGSIPLGGHEVAVPHRASGVGQPLGEAVFGGVHVLGQIPPWGVPYDEDALGRSACRAGIEEGMKGRAKQAPVREGHCVG